MCNCWYCCGSGGGGGGDGDGGYSDWPENETGCGFTNHSDWLSTPPPWNLKPLKMTKKPKPLQSKPKQLKRLLQRPNHRQHCHQPTSQPASSSLPSPFLLLLLLLSSSTVLSSVQTEHQYLFRRATTTGTKYGIGIDVAAFNGYWYNGFVVGLTDWLAGYFGCVVFNRPETIERSSNQYRHKSVALAVRQPTSQPASQPAMPGQASSNSSNSSCQAKR